MIGLQHIYTGCRCQTLSNLNEIRPILTYSHFTDQTEYNWRLFSKICKLFLLPFFTYIWNTTVRYTNKSHQPAKQTKLNNALVFAIQIFECFFSNDFRIHVCLCKKWHETTHTQKIFKQRKQGKGEIRTIIPTTYLIIYKAPEIYKKQKLLFCKKNCVLPGETVFSKTWISCRVICVFIMLFCNGHWGIIVDVVVVDDWLTVVAGKVLLLQRGNETEEEARKKYTLGIVV